MKKLSDYYSLWTFTSTYTFIWYFNIFVYLPPFSADKTLKTNLQFYVSFFHLCVWAPQNQNWKISPYPPTTRLKSLLKKDLRHKSTMFLWREMCNSIFYKYNVCDKLFILCLDIINLVQTLQTNAFSLNTLKSCNVYRNINR